MGFGLQRVDKGKQMKLSMRIVFAMLLLGHGSAFAQISWGEEYAKRLKSAQTVAPLTDSIFGDEISLFTGGVTFSATDVALPGNNALQVAFSRRLDFSDQTANKSMGRWEIDLPRLSGIYPAGSPWVPSARCSTVGSPPTVNGFSPQEYWSGNELRYLVAAALSSSGSLPTQNGAHLRMVPATTGSRRTTGTFPAWPVCRVVNQVRGFWRSRLMERSITSTG
jgi:hypothetical protein